MTDSQGFGATFTARKQASQIQISHELLMDDPDYWWAHATPEQKAEANRRQARWEALRTAGLLDDEGSEIRLNDCPACTTVGNYDSTDSVRCELMRGHAGSHSYRFEWEA